MSALMWTSATEICTKSVHVRAFAPKGQVFQQLELI